jgi:hypothetical protein
MKKTLVTLLCVFALSHNVFAIKTNVTPGAGTLSAAVTAAASGDTLVLTNGGAYSEAAQMVITKTLTIKAADWIPVTRPVITYTGTNGGVGSGLFKLGAGAVFVLRSIEIDGGGLLYVVISGDYTAPANVTLKVYNNYWHNVTNYAIGEDSPTRTIAAGYTWNNLVLDGVTFAKGFSGKCILLKNYTFTNPPVFQNLTFYFCSGQSFRMDASVAPTGWTWTLNHCTFDHNGSAGKENIGMKPSLPDSGTLIIKNCIISNPIAKSGNPLPTPVIAFQSGSTRCTIANCDTFQLGNTLQAISDTYVLPAGTGMNSVDPMYQDTAHGNYTVTNATLLTAGDDGKQLGSLQWYQTPSVNPTSVDKATELSPTSFTLNQNYPNPFNPSTQITYQVGKTGFVSVKIYNILGQEVATLVNEVKQAGTYPVTWVASQMTSGVYFCRMQSGSYSATTKMILTK